MPTRKMKPMMTIYLLHIKCTDRRYVGASKKGLAIIKHRFSTDARRFQTEPGTLLDDVKKCGVDRCVFIELEKCKPEESAARVLYYVDYFKTLMPEGYNRKNDFIR